MTLLEMTLASAATPDYFRPAIINDDVYISGDNVALSPAMFAYFYAIERKAQDPADIKVISVGATNELPEKIDEKSSLADWLVRLETLNAPVKKHTQDYMVEYLLNRDGITRFWKFEHNINEE